jgi:hypothetical protein
LRRFFADIRPALVRLGKLACKALRFLVFAHALQFTDLLPHPFQLRVAIPGRFTVAGLLTQFLLDLLGAGYQLLRLFRAAFGFRLARFFGELFGFGAEIVQRGGGEAGGKQGAEQRREEERDFHIPQFKARQWKKQPAMRRSPGIR